jgi:hypothetical protein
MDAVLDDLAQRGFAAAEIAWLGPLAFYEKACAATVSRRFAHMVRRL